MKPWRIHINGSDDDALVRELREGALVLGGVEAGGVQVVKGCGLDAKHVRISLDPAGLLVEKLTVQGTVYVDGQMVREPVRRGVPFDMRVGDALVRCEPCAEAQVSVEEMEEVLPDLTLRLVHAGEGRAPKIGSEIALQQTGRIFHGGGRPEGRFPAEVFRIEEVLDRTAVYSMETSEGSSDEALGAEAHYELGEELSRGGMGRVYLAREQGLNRQVALKISSVGGVGMDARFLREAEVLANLAHPNIVPVYNSGRDGMGRPFYSMKLVKGRTLQAILNKLRVEAEEEVREFTRERLLLIFLKVCDAVAFAHAQGFLHRDLKPENVMVGEFGEVLVLDWGLAKRLSKQGAAEAGEAEFVETIEGTPRFMSPEQAQGMLGGLDERSDVYSLGAVLFAMLALRPCVDGRSVEEVLNRVRRGETTTLSFRKGDQTGVHAGPVSGRRVPEALRAVTMKAMALDREQRYQSVQELARDVEAYNNGFATGAEEAGVMRLLVLLVRRNRLASLMVLLMLSGAVASAVRLNQEKREALRHAYEARTQRRLAEDKQKIALQERERALEFAKEAQQQRQRAEDKEKVANEERARAVRLAVEAQVMNAEGAERSLNAKEMRLALERVAPENRDANWNYLMRRTDTAHRQFSFAPHPFSRFEADLGRPGRVWFVSDKRWLSSLDLNTGGVEKLFPVTANLAAYGVSPDGSRVALLYNDFKAKAGILEILDLEKDGRLGQVVFPTGGDTKVVFSPSGAHVMVFIAGKAVYMVETASARLLWEEPVEQGTAAYFSNERYLHIFKRVEYAIHAVPTGLVSVRVPLGWTVQYRQHEKLAFLPSNASFAYVQGDALRKVSLRDGAVKFERPLLPGASASANLVTLPELGWGLVLSEIAEESAAIQIWDLVPENRSNRLLQQFPLEMEKKGLDWSVVAHPLSNQVAVARGNTIKVWDFADPRTDGVLSSNTLGPLAREGFGFLSTPDTVCAPTLLGAPQGTGVRDTELEVFRITGAQPVREAAVELVPGAFAVGAVSRDGRFVATSTWPSSTMPARMELFRSGYAGVEPVRQLNIRTGISGFALNADGSRIWLGGEVVRTDVFAPPVLVKRGEIAPYLRKAPRTPYRSVQRWLNKTQVVELAMVPSEALQTGGGKGMGRALVVWDADTGAAERVISAPNALSLAVSADDAFVAEAGADRRVRIRRAADLGVEKEYRVHDAPVSAVEWHPSQPWLATASEDFLLRIWDVTTGALLEEMGFFKEVPSTLYWSPDGGVLALCFESSKSYQFVRPKVAKAPGSRDGQPR